MSIPQPRRPPSPTQDLGNRGETSGDRARSCSESLSPAVAQFRLIANAGVSSPASETSEVVPQRYGISPPLGDDALAFVPDADRERSSRCAVGDVRRASVASRSPALPPRRPLSRAGVLGGVTAGVAVLSCGVQVILDEGVDDASVCSRSDGGDWKA